MLKLLEKITNEEVLECIGETKTISSVERIKLDWNSSKNKLRSS